MIPFTNYLQALLALFCLSGCCSYKIPTEQLVLEKLCREEDPRLYQQKAAAAIHPLYKIIPRHRSQIRCYDLGHWITWGLFGNDKAGLFGEDNSFPFLIDHPVSCAKALRWALRNPLHNFTFYVIGSAYTQNSRFTICELSQEGCRAFKYKALAPRRFTPPGFSFLCALHGWKPFIYLQVPYTDLKEGIIYIGWRDQGNFGVKFAPWTRTKQSWYPKEK